ncbi:YdeI/OmpD-associated family protein [Vacuolonema iberomarrocanum]|uniref:YdeI/OmpD-associated family protein n=1 Tax=Vacuolonema iberomarrocanum TaxID=3454632 RepID=UPI0019E92A22|nr:YdeI/OmpD-associated family protein [filamentous cyanobacterium LEGE 07170]
MSNNAEHIQVEHRDEWRRWLMENYDRNDGIWLVTFKKQCGDKYVSYDAVVEEALCFGWIDSLPRKLDEERTMLWMAPRKASSGWSKLNKERIATMIEAGRMTPAGLAKIEAAKQDGSWTALDAIEALEIPPDLQTALDADPVAKQNFEAFPKSAKRGILEWIISAKRPETRAKRVAETTQLAAENKRANQWRKT